MSLAAELLWQLLPPLTFGTDGIVITAALAPVHDVGGDAFDYAVNGDSAQFAVFDAMGHGLPAGSMATIAVAAYRSSRRRGLGLAETAAFIDDAIATHVGGSRYVTGVLAQLELSSGRLRWCIAGHPRPVILRRGRIVRTLDSGAHVPFGLGARPAVGQESLEPDDRVLLYTDGITEARAASGEPFGLDRFADIVSRTSSEEMPPPEMMRRLMHAIVDHQVGELRDDATAVMVQWPGDAIGQLTVEGLER
jgi:serine phosphatase RsbU (regulator of sigma subunit)